MLTCLIGRAQTLHFTLAEQFGLIQIALSEVFRSSDKVYQTLIHIQSYFVDVVEITLGNWKNFLTITAYTIQMTITATFAFPSKILVALQPMDIVVSFYPCLICIRKDMNRIVFTDFGNPYLIGILFTIHLLDEKFVACRNKFHTRNIIVAGITWNIDPSSSTTFYRYITHFHCRIGSTCLRIRETLDSRIDGIYIINNVKPTSTIGITLPVSNELAVRTPTETVTTTEFFFVYPVECTVYNLFIAILSQLKNGTVCQCFHIDIVL